MYHKLSQVHLSLINKGLYDFLVFIYSIKLDFPATFCGFVSGKCVVKNKDWLIRLIPLFIMDD